VFVVMAEDLVRDDQDRGPSIGKDGGHVPLLLLPFVPTDLGAKGRDG
jgi:hypothetical protein